MYDTLYVDRVLGNQLQELNVGDHIIHGARLREVLGFTLHLGVVVINTRDEKTGGIMKIKPDNTTQKVTVTE